jgi:hypothetical protein
MIIYFLIVVIGSFIAGKLILGELRKERRDYVVLVAPASQSIPEEPKTSAPIRDHISPAAYTPFIKVESPTERLSNWEKILAGKNLEIEKLTKALESQRSQTQEIEKIKILLERQIFESRQMNRNIKRELDALMTQGQKSQDEITKLQVELNYKNQLINQHEVKMSELKNRIATILPSASATTPEPVQKSESDLGDFSFDQLDWRKKLSE